MKYLFVFIGFFVPLSLWAAGEGIGESMKLDFYSQIERGNYSISQKLINTRLREYKDMNEFISSCTFGIRFPPNTPVDPTVLDSARSGNYGPLSKYLGGRDATSDAQLSTDQLTSLYSCINNKYDQLIKSSDRQVDNIRTLSSIGVYTDGSTDNSDYDIISDINKINDIVFIEKIGYNSNKNIGKLALQDLLSGNVPKLYLTPQAQGITTSITNGTTNPTTTSPVSSNSPTQSSSTPINLGQNLAAGWCSETPTVPFSNPDNALLSEIESVIRYGTVGSVGDGIGGSYASASTDPNSPLGSIPLSRSTSPERSDFFHLPNCDGFFCVRFNMIGNSTNLLGGGNKFSIESLLNQRYKEINEISQYDLTAQTMTQGFYESTKPGFKFSDSIGGLRVFLSDQSAKTYNLKKEDNPNDVMKRRQDCAFNAAGLISTDWVKSNAFFPEAYINKNGSTTDTIDPRIIQMGPNEKKLSDLCVSQEIQLARRGYTESFSTDLNEIQGFTHQMLDFISLLIAQVDVIGKKGTTQP